MTFSDRAPTSTARAGLVYAGWLAVVLLTSAWTPYTLIQSYWIHRYYDHDSEIGFETWTFHFRLLEITAPVLGLVIGVCLWRLSSARAGMALPVLRIAAIAPAVLLNLLVLVAAMRAESIWNGGPSSDPSGWMNAAALALLAQLIAACVVGAGWIRIAAAGPDRVPLSVDSP